MHDLPQQVINGLSIGAVYALIALGYTMVYGVLRLINFAHGDVYMVGAVIGYELAVPLAAHHVPAWLSLPLMFLGAMVGCAALGFSIEYCCYRPLRSRPRLVVLITAIGVSLLLENLFQNPAVFGAVPRTLPSFFPSDAAHVGFTFSLGSAVVKVSWFNLLSLALCLVLTLVLSWFVMCTRMGLAFRAVSFRFDTACLMGINTDRVISMAFVLGSALAAVAGVIDAMRYDVEPLMGMSPGIKAFVAAVLGGIGSIPGAVLGGLLMGMIETLLKGWILPQHYTGYADAAAFFVLILILLVRPTGLLGREITDKV